MVKVPEEIKKIFEKQRVIPIATADKKARPNVVLVGMWFWADDETLVISDNYLNKTKKNLEENPQIAINGWAEGKSYQIKGKVHFETSGPLAEKVKEIANRGERKFPGKAAVVVKIEEVFQGSGGQSAGDKLV